MASRSLDALYYLFVKRLKRRLRTHHWYNTRYCSTLFYHDTFWIIFHLAYTRIPVPHVYLYCSISGPHLALKSTFQDWLCEFQQWTPDANLVMLTGTKDELSLSGSLLNVSKSVYHVWNVLTVIETTALKKFLSSISSFYSDIVHSKTTNLSSFRGQFNDLRFQQSWNTDEFIHLQVHPQPPNSLVR